MANAKRAWDGISKMCPGAASAALALVLVLVLGVATTQPAQAQTFTLLHSFTGSPDGAAAYAPLIRDAAGNLYSTTEGGGAYGYGTVFKASKSGKVTVLYSFTGGSDGANPFVGLLRDKAGNLYGTTAYGGASSVGTVFKLSKSGKETVLHSFAGGTADGCYPFGGLLRDAAGNFYGTTEVCGASGVGTVFKLSEKGVLTLLHSFAGGSSDGEYPSFTTLLMDKTGNIYGVAEQGGTYNLGVAYKLSKSGKLTVLHSFAGGSTDGCDVFGTPVRDSKGNLYGTANACGSSEVGIVWKVSPKGTETILHSFAGGASDGEEPIAGLIADAKGNLYGDTYQGGPANLGTVYKLDEKGTLTLLHTFSGSDGSYPYSGLLRDATGTLYGTTLYGGSDDFGTVWKLTK
jgi:uncharacterized repeat protein (TIGR03803 family)